MTIACIIISLLAIIAALAATFTARPWAPLAALCALVVLTATPANVPTLSTILFWGAAAAIAFGINKLLPPAISQSRTGLAYIAAASLAGTFVGLIISQAAMIIGAVAGAFIGALAFSRTPAGTAIRSPFGKFVNYICAKAMPAVITCCICGISAIYIILLIQSMQ